MSDDGATVDLSRPAWLRTSRGSHLRRQIAVGVATGVLAGMATFAWTQAAMLPEWYPRWALLAAIGAAGGFSHLLATSLRGSVRIMAISFFTAIAVDLAGWIAPLWLEPYPPGTRDVLIQQYLQSAMPDVIMTYFLVYMAGYLTLLSIGGYMDW